MADLRVYKYELSPSAELELPAGAKVLSVGFQDEQLQLWALINVSVQRKERRLFCTYGTGHEIPYDDAWLRFVGTSHTSGGLVFHTFEVTCD